MYIEKLLLRNFGKFNNFEVELEPGLNVIYGDNESGKSTLFAFIRGMLFGVEKQRGRAAKSDVYSKLEPWNNPTFFEGKCELVKGGVHYNLERRFYKSDKYFSVVNRDTGERLSSEAAADFLADLSESRYMNTISIAQSKPEDETELIKELQNCIANLDVSHGVEMDVEEACRCLRAKKKDFSKKLLPELCEEIVRAEDALMLVRHEAEQISDKKASTEKRLSELEEQRKAFKNRRKNRIALIGIVSVSLILVLLVLLLFLDNKYAWIIAILTSCIASVGALGILHTWTRCNKDFKSIYASFKAESGELVKQGLLMEQCREKEAVLEEELEELREKAVKNREIEVETEALQLALDTLEEISLKLRAEFSGKLNNRISQLVEIFTCGEYSEIKMDKDGGIYVFKENTFIPIEQLSKGTIEQIRLAVRLIVADDVFGFETIPIVLDEGFVYFDDKRLREILKSLSKLDRQIIIFSCHKRESELLREENIEFKEICL